MTTSYKVIGQRVRRQDAGPRLTGHERYTADLSLPGMLHAAFVLSTQAHARIVSIDAAAALAVPGVERVVTAADLPEFARNDAELVREVFFLAHERVLYAGQHLAVVLAETPEAAEEAAELVRVEYAPLAPALDLDLALSDDAATVHPELGHNRSAAVRFERGDVDAALANAAGAVSGEFHSEAVYQSYLEPRAVVADADAIGRVTVYTPTQGQFAMRSMIAQALRLPEHDVIVQPMVVGGGFGAKFVLFEPLVALLAQLAGRPVKLVLTRSADFVATIQAPQSRVRATLTADGAGRITAIDADIVVDTGAFSHSPYQLMGLMMGSWYPAANLRISSTEVYTNRSGAAAYRAPGLTPLAFALEQLVDELARGLGLSPLELRARNVARPGDPMADGVPWPDQQLTRLLTEAVQHPLWTAPKQPGEGVGVAIGAMRGSSEPASASVRLIADGALSISVGSIDITGTNGALAQIAAETFGLPLEQVRVATAPANLAPHSGGSGGSKILYTVGNAVVAATRDAREQALDIAAELLEVDVDDLELTDGVVRVFGAPDRTLTLKELASNTSGLSARFAPVHGQGNVANRTKAPGVTVHLARVRVDAETGEVAITGYAALHDVGKAINPAEVEGQIQGGVAQGVGWAFYEALRFDADGQPLTAGYMDYALPRASQTPAIETCIFEFPSPEGPFGAKGIGEPPVIPPAAALANAIHDATGVRLRRLPMTAERVWRALHDDDGAA